MKCFKGLITTHPSSPCVPPPHLPATQNLIRKNQWDTQEEYTDNVGQSYWGWESGGDYLLKKRRWNIEDRFIFSCVNGRYKVRECIYIKFWLSSGQKHSNAVASLAPVIGVAPSNHPESRTWWPALKKHLAW